MRVRRSLPEWPEWAECFDWQQGNEAEIAIVAGVDEPEVAVRRLVERGASAAFCTLGASGVAWASPAGSGRDRVEPSGDPITDPTGCGDVWGAACVASLVADESISDAVRRANRFAATSATHRGTTGLSARLREVVPAGDGVR